MEIAGVPKAVHGAFILGLPVDAKPNGAGPIAAGDKITGVALYSSATRALHSAIYRLDSNPLSQFRDAAQIHHKYALDCALRGKMQISQFARIAYDNAVRVSEFVRT